MIFENCVLGKFRLGDEKYFIIKRGESKYIKNMNVGDYPYVSTTGENNGISAYVSEYNREGNLITLAYDGSIGACFYQRDRFFASEKIVTIDIVGHNLNEFIALYLVQILKLEAELYSYGGRKWTVEQQLKNTYVKLPINKYDEPDWDYMENFIKELNINKNNIINEIPDYFLKEGYNKACWYLDNINKKEFENKYSNPFSTQKTLLNDRSWKEFDLVDFFIPELSKGDIKINESIEGDIPLISAVNGNNGICGYIAFGDGKAQLFHKGCLTADMFGHVYYQPKNFYSVSHGRVNVLIPKINLNKYQSLFIAKVLEYQFLIRNSYSRMLNKTLLRKCKILLPIKDDETPDWNTMENFIKSLPFSCNI